MQKLTGRMMWVVVHTICLLSCLPKQQTKALKSLFGDCLPQNCGLNGAWLGQGIRFRTLHVLPDVGPSAPNREHVRITAFQKWVSGALVDLKMAVVRDELIGTIGGVAQDLTDAWINLEAPKEECIATGCAQRDTYRLTIKEVLAPAFWTACNAPGTPVCERSPARTHAYRFKVTSAADSRPVTLCEPGLSDDKTLAGTAVIFIGDVYDDAQGVNVRSVDGDAGHGLHEGEGDLFNIACYGTALSKLQFVRHTAASAFTGYMTTIGQRKTILQLLAADYPGDGSSFTEYARAIKLDFNHPPFSPTSGPVGLGGMTSVDAIWSADGSAATCVDTPRLSGVSGHTKESILGEVKDRNPDVGIPCDPPKVQQIIQTGSVDWANFPKSYAISAN